MDLSHSRPESESLATALAFLPRNCGLPVPVMDVLSPGGESLSFTLMDVKYRDILLFIVSQ